MTQHRSPIYDRDIHWLILGFIISAGYLIGLAKYSIGPIAATVVIALMLIYRNRETGLTWWLVLLIVLWGHWRHGPQTLGWDIVSFELQTFHDWRHNQRPAYWDYSMLSTIYHGAWSTLGTKFITGAYGMSCLMFCAAISLVLTRMRTVAILSMLIGTLIIITRVADSIFILGKGDMLSTSFSLICLFYVLSILQENSTETEDVRLCNAIIFGALAISTKLSAVLFVAPAAIIALISRPKFIIRSWKGLTPGLIVTLLLFTPFFLNLWQYGSVLDQEGNSIAARFTIYANLSGFYQSLHPPTHEITLFISLLTIISGWCIFRSRKFSWEKLALWFVFLASLLFTPWVWLNGADNPENFRLIVFPLMGMLIISHEH